MSPFYFIDLPIYVALGAGFAFVGWRRGRAPAANGKQSWQMTLAEVATGKVVGVSISYLMNLFLLPYLLDAPVSPREAALVSSAYLAVATVRSLITRRVFEHLRTKGIGQ